MPSVTSANVAGTFSSAVSMLVDVPSFFVIVITPVVRLTDTSATRLLVSLVTYACACDRTPGLHLPPFVLP